MQGDCSPSEPKPLGDILWVSEGVTGRQGGPSRGGVEPRWAPRVSMCVVEGGVPG